MIFNARNVDLPPNFFSWYQGRANCAAFSYFQTPLKIFRFYKSPDRSCYPARSLMHLHHYVRSASTA
jgi:hypothetical protein